MSKDDRRYTTFRSGLELIVDANPPDILLLGATNISLHRIINKVATQSLREAATGSVLPFDQRPFRRNPFGDPTLIRVDIQSIRSGSIEQYVLFSVAAAISNPFNIAILENLSANVIWAVGAAAMRSIRGTIVGTLPHPTVHADVSANITSLISRLSRRGTPCSFAIKQRSSDGATTEVTFRIP